MYEAYNSKRDALLRYVYKMKTVYIFHFITNKGTFIIYTTQSITVHCADRYTLRNGILFLRSAFYII